MPSADHSTVSHKNIKKHLILIMLLRRSIMSFDLLFLALQISCKIVLGVKAVCLKRDRNHMLRSCSYKHKMTWKWDISALSMKSCLIYMHLSKATYIAFKVIQLISSCICWEAYILQHFNWISKQIQKKTWCFSFLYMCMKLDLFHDTDLPSLTDFLFTDKLIHRTAGNIKPIV